MFKPFTGNRTLAAEYAAEQMKADPGGTLGPWLLALVGLTYMMGVLAIQAIRYFSTFGIESSWYFGLVVTCIVLSLLQWAIIMQASWNWFVVNFGVWDIWAQSPWQAWSSPIINQVMVFIAQTFFAHRCYTLYGRNKLIYGSLIFGSFAAVVLFVMVGLAVKADSGNFVVIREWTIPALCVNFSTDFAITTLTLWKLGWHHDTLSPSTNNVLRRLRNLTIEAAVPPAICALLNMALYLSQGSRNLIFTWFAVMTPRFYISSLMFALNSRLKIRETLNSRNDNESLSTHFEFANHTASGRQRRRDDTRRTTVVFATMTGATCPPNASMGLVDEHISNGGEDRRVGDVDSKVYDDSLVGRSRSELQVDLDRWDKEPPLRSFSGSIASICLAGLERTGVSSKKQEARRPSDAT